MEPHEASKTPYTLSDFILILKNQYISDNNSFNF